MDEAGPSGGLGGGGWGWLWGRASMWENWSSLASSKVLEILQDFFFSFKAFFETFYTIFAVNSFILFGAVRGPGCCTQAFSSCGARASHVVASLTVDLGLWAHGLQ